MSRFVAHLVLVVILFGGAVVPAVACNGRAPAPRYQCHVRPTPAAPQVAPRPVYCVCTPDENGVMQVRGTTTNKDDARRTAEILEANGIKAWAMEMKPVPRGGGFTLSNGEAAMAFAYNIGPGKTRAAAISDSGRAEAIAQ